MAQRVFSTVSFLQKTTRHAVALDRQLRSSGHSAPDAVDARAEFSKLKLDYKYQSDYWQHRVQEQESI
ncbi:hypothetical protein PC128_g8647 [Phytophthora cactorum]|nr:hypothetical protein PC128_g8647 [Phytophthora cactorum]